MSHHLACFAGERSSAFRSEHLCYPCDPRSNLHSFSRYLAYFAGKGLRLPAFPSEHLCYPCYPRSKSGSDAAHLQSFRVFRGQARRPVRPPTPCGASPLPCPAAAVPSEGDSPGQTRPASARCRSKPECTSSRSRNDRVSGQGRDFRHGCFTRAKILQDLFYATYKGSITRGALTAPLWFQHVNSREIHPNSLRISGGENPAHQLRMSADKKIRQRNRRSITTA